MEQVTFDKALQKRLVEEWISDLRKPGMRQAVGSLELDDGSQCCLGVACRTFDRLMPGILEIFRSSSVLFSGEVAALPAHAQNAMGIRDYLGAFDNGHNRLSSLNDQGNTFPEIADIIEREWNDRKPGGLFLTDEELAARP